MSAMGRRQFVLGTAAILGASAVPTARAQQLRNVAFITPFGYLIGFAPCLNAQAGGYFAKQGLDVTVLPGKGSAVAVQQVIAGRALYGRGDPIAMAKAIAEGAPIVAFATIEHKSPIVIYSSPKNPIRSAKDMAGKMIGIAAKGSASDNILDMILAMNGMPLDAVRREAIGNSPGGWGLIQQGRVDAHIVSLGTTTTLKESGENIVIWNTSDAVSMPGQAYFALRETVEKDPKVLLGILRATKESILDVKKADGRVIVERVAKQWEVEGAKNVDFTVKSMRDEEVLWWQDDTSKLLKNDPATWKSMVDAMQKAGLLKSGSASDFYTDAIVSQL
jgi:NitT/TauT family transport system substrate-binding protein